DREGKILYYNAREEQIAGRRKENVIGRNFFTEVAPCTQVRDFYGRFQEAMNRPGWTVNFQFRFPFPDNPREVEIALTSFENKGDRLCLISVN
ncbi:PAS domain-containing protein, partial [Acinetobacter baumannii]